MNPRLIGVVALAVIGVLVVRQSAIRNDAFRVTLIAAAMGGWRDVHGEWPRSADELPLPPLDKALVTSGQYPVCWPDGEPRDSDLLVLSKPLPGQPWTVAAATAAGRLVYVSPGEAVCP